MTSIFPKQTAEQLFDNVYEPLPNSIKSENPRKTTPYNIRNENWFKSIPYALRIVNLPGQGGIVGPVQEKPMHFFFPVNPESVSINTPYAVVVTPTLGGIVQEHSGAVFYNITLSGTTGVIPELDYTTGIPRAADTELRPTVSDGNLINSGAAGGFGQNTINLINSAVSAITGTSSKMVDSSRNRKSGYTEYHVLYKFIWLYNYAKANGAKYQLRFVNYKDNNQYDCVVQNFSLSRDKSRPHLYQYTIQLKAWRLGTADQFVGETGESLKARLKSLGLSDEPSVKALAFRAITSTKTVLNSASGLLNAAAQDLAF